MIRKKFVAQLIVGQEAAPGNVSTRELQDGVP
jgi:hypothetical protein